MKLECGQLYKALRSPNSDLFLPELFLYDRIADVSRANVITIPNKSLVMYIATCAASASITSKYHYCKMIKVIYLDCIGYLACFSSNSYSKNKPLWEDEIHKYFAKVDDVKP